LSSPVDVERCWADVDETLTGVSSVRILSIMIYDDSRDAVIERLANVVGQIGRALEAGLAVSRAIHAEREWRPEADRALWPYLARREALEHLRDYNPAADEAGEEVDNLGLPMSGIRLEPNGHDVVRVWRSRTGDLPQPLSVPVRDYYDQKRVGVGELPFDDQDDGPEGRARNHMAVLWWDEDGVLTRLDLVRPVGVESRRGIAEWSESMLTSGTNADLGYPPLRDDEEGEGAG